MAVWPGEHRFTIHTVAGTRSTGSVSIEPWPLPTRTPRASWIDAALARSPPGGPDAVRVELLAKALGVDQGRGPRPRLRRPRRPAGGNARRLGGASMIDEAIARVRNPRAAPRGSGCGGCSPSRPRSRDLLESELAIRDWARRDPAVAERPAPRGQPADRAILRPRLRLGLGSFRARRGRELAASSLSRRGIANHFHRRSITAYRSRAQVPGASAMRKLAAPPASPRRGFVPSPRQRGEAGKHGSVRQAEQARPGGRRRRRARPGSKSSTRPGGATARLNSLPPTGPAARSPGAVARDTVRVAGHGRTSSTTARLHEGWVEAPRSEKVNLSRSEQRLRH